MLYLYRCSLRKSCHGLVDITIPYTHTADNHFTCTPPLHLRYRRCFLLVLVLILVIAGIGFCARRLLWFDIGDDLEFDAEEDQNIPEVLYSVESAQRYITPEENPHVCAVRSPIKHLPTSSFPKTIKSRTSH